MIVGNDISRWQGDVNFDVYKNNSNFLIIKTSEGIGFVDPKFLRNQREARRVGLPLGYYHFARPDLFNSPEAEAEFFLKTIGEIREGEVLCLDYEPASNPYNVVLWCKGFLDRVFVRTGCKAFIYLNKSQVKGFDWRVVVDANYALWLACYDSNIISGQWAAVAMQQRTSSQSVPGIVGNVDGNYFFGTLEQFKAYGYKKPVTPSPSVSPSPSPSSSVSPSTSPSVSTSPSLSPSPSKSPSKSPSGSESSSPSSSPSPSPSPEPGIDYKEVVMKTCEVLNKKWTWLGKNGWKNRLAELKIIYHNI